MQRKRKRAHAAKKGKGKAKQRPAKITEEDRYSREIAGAAMNDPTFRLSNISDHLHTNGWVLVGSPWLTPRVCPREPAIPMGTPRHGSCYEFFKLMWTNTIIRHLVIMTNKKLPCNHNLRVTQQEVRKYFGQHCIFGIYKLSCEADLWASGAIEFRYPGKKQGLSRDRWMWINTHLQYDVKRLHSLLEEAFQNHLLPGTYVHVDEHRDAAQHEGCPFLSYNNKKPARWAIQSLTLHDESGYLYSLTDPTIEDPLTPFETLLFFGRKLHGKGRKFHFTADILFSNVEQARKLVAQGHHCTLACKSDRPTFLFKDGLSEDLPQYWSRFAVQDDLVAVTYHQRNKINLVSSVFEATEAESWTKENRHQVLDLYDRTKHAADHFNQLCSNYHNPHVHKRWEGTLLTGWFEMALTNAYILYDMVSPTKVTHKEFIAEVSLALLLDGE